VPASYLPLLAALEAGPRPHVDLVIANEVDSRPALIAVGATGVTIVDPSNGPDGPHVVHLAYSAVHGARVVKEGMGRHALRWFVVDADEPLSVPLSRRGAEAASQLAFVVNKRLGGAVAAERRPARVPDDRVLGDARKLRELHATGVLSDHEYRAAMQRLSANSDGPKRQYG
jgi:hypothetical protein